MDTAHKAALVGRIFEELDRVISRNPDLTLREISVELGRNKNFLSDLRNRPGSYVPSIEDICRLNEKYDIDDIYILKGIRYKVLIDAKNKLDAIRSLLNHI